MKSIMLLIALLAVTGCEKENYWNEKYDAEAKCEKWFEANNGNKYEQCLSEVKL